MSTKNPADLLSARRAERRAKAYRPLGEPTPGIEPAVQSPSVAQEQPTAATMDDAAPAKSPRPPKAPAGRGRVSAWMPVECFAMLRDAWWSDLDYGGDHTAASQGAWLGRALLDYTGLDFAERKRIREGLPDWSQSESQARSWMVVKEAHAALRDTVEDDRKLHQRATTQSSLIIEAIAYGYAGATTRRGGAIPSAPDDLPTRTMVR